MKIVDLTDEKSEREPVAALIQSQFLENPYLVFRYKDSVVIVYDDHSGHVTEWNTEINDVTNRVMKFYYPGDRITIEV